MNNQSINEELILVNHDDAIVGYADKYSCHTHSPALHRALSVFLLRPDGQILLQRRSAYKLLWPHHWSNACCTHPRRGEECDERALTRIQEELGVLADITYAYSFSYKATYENIGTEHELCYVYIGLVLGEPAPNPVEVEEICYLEPSELTTWMEEIPTAFTPWSIIEWEEIMKNDYITKTLATLHSMYTYL